ncbi:MAG: DUF167 family protein [Thiotrichaceae bacterium]|nr:DUF167 family protein [Thiotrichaceae bacterium]
MRCFYQWDHQDLLLAVHVQPRSSKTEIIGVYGERLKIKITAPPVDGKANKELIKLFAKLFSVPKSHIYLLNGETSREKRFKIQAPSKLPDFIQK